MEKRTDAQATDSYYTVAEACEILNICRRTLYSWIDKGRLKTEKQGKNRMILLNETSVIKADFSSSSGLHKSSEYTDGEYTDAQTAQSETTQSEAAETAQIDTEAFDLLKSDLEHFKSKTVALEEELAKVRTEKEEASKRHDTIVMQLSGTINDTQFQLQEARKLNFIQRIFDFF